MTGPAGCGQDFGSVLALRGDRQVAGAPGQLGGVWVFDRSGPTWNPSGRILPSQVEPISEFGDVLAVDGTMLVLGTKLDEHFGVWSGSAWSYLLPAAQSSHCSAKLHSLGCTPSISFTGMPCASGVDDFHVTASGVLNPKPGMLLWSLSPDALPFAGGTLCPQDPVTRTPTQYASGSPPPGVDCAGTCDFHFGHTYIASPSPAPGTEVFAPFWSRDRGIPPPSDVGLTDALRLVICR